MVALAALAVMLLWNAVITSIFGLGVITYLQALGLLALCRILFGGFGGIKQRAIDHRMSKEQRAEHIREHLFKE